MGEFRRNLKKHSTREVEKAVCLLLWLLLKYCTKAIFCLARQLAEDVAPSRNACWGFQSTSSLAFFFLFVCVCKHFHSLFSWFSERWPTWYLHSCVILRVCVCGWHMLFLRANPSAVCQLMGVPHNKYMMETGGALTQCSFFKFFYYSLKGGNWWVELTSMTAETASSVVNSALGRLGDKFAGPRHICAEDKHSRLRQLVVTPGWLTVDEEEVTA